MSVTAEDLKRRLESSLPPSAEEAQETAKRAIEGKDPEEAKDQKVVGDPRASREYTFTLDHQDSRGKRWTGQFTTKILSMSERSLVGAMRAQMSGAQPYEALDPLTRELNLIRAHLPVCLIKRPKWAEKLDSIEDFTVLQAVYAEVSSHEDYFHGFGHPAGASPGGGA